MTTPLPSPTNSLHAPPPQLLDVKAVAAQLGCSTRHAYRLADAGKMPRPIKLGALVKWRRDEIEAWIAGGCKPVRAPGAKGGAS
jgi:excisionase family DNA binding protein